MGRAAVALSMQTFFFYGTLCHPALLQVVLGRDVTATPASLADHAVHWVQDESFPMIAAAPGAVAQGVLVTGLSEEDVARLDFYEGGFAYGTRDFPVTSGGRDHIARVYFPDTGHWQAGAHWSLDDWVAQWGSTVVETAGEFMSLFGARPSVEVLRRYPMMLARGASALRARAPGPTTLRHHAQPGDVQVLARRQPYARFFAVEEYDLTFRRFDGSLSAPMNRAVFVSSDAATVLPYDPVRDRVLVIEQFRAGPFGRGDAQPWQIEAIAGRVDAGETPEAAARREALDEAGVTLGDLLPVSSYYPTPGAKTEYIYSYVGLVSLPDGMAGVGGLDSEGEDIRAHLIGFDALMALIDSGEVNNAPLLLTAMWLDRHRARLRADTAR
jgi:ADP-ribose pyrophosphatase